MARYASRRIGRHFSRARAATCCAWRRPTVLEGRPRTSVKCALFVQPDPAPAEGSEPQARGVELTVGEMRAGPRWRPKWSHLLHQFHPKLSRAAAAAATATRLHLAPAELEPIQLDQIQQFSHFCDPREPPTVGRAGGRPESGAAVSSWEVLWSALRGSSATCCLRLSSRLIHIKWPPVCRIERAGSGGRLKSARLRPSNRLRRLAGSPRSAPNPAKALGQTNAPVDCSFRPPEEHPLGSRAESDPRAGQQQVAGWRTLSAGSLKGLGPESRARQQVAARAEPS